MTIPYNARFKSNWGYVKDALIDKGVVTSVSNKEERALISETTHALRNAVWDRDTETGIFPGPIKVMDWIEKKVSDALSDGRTELKWVTPSGFVVKQKIMEPEITRISLQLLGKAKKVSVKTGDSDVVNVQKHKSATSPNLIHSLDASILCLSAIRFDHPLALIHDSVLCRATDMHLLSRLVRETYMYIFAEHNYLEEWAQQIGVEFDSSVIVGDLETENVMNSTYFFC